MSKEDSASNNPEAKGESREYSVDMTGQYSVNWSMEPYWHHFILPAAPPEDPSMDQKKGTTMPSQKCDKVSNGRSNQSLRNEVPAERPSSVLRPFPPIHSNVAGKKPHTAP